MKISEACFIFPFCVELGWVELELDTHWVQAIMGIMLAAVWTIDSIDTAPGLVVTVRAGAGELATDYRFVTARESGDSRVTVQCSAGAGVTHNKYIVADVVRALSSNVMLEELYLVQGTQL